MEQTSKSMRPLIEALGRKLRTLHRRYETLGPAETAQFAWSRINKLDWVQFGIRGRILPWRVNVLKSISGTAPGPHEVIAFSVVRNGMPWLGTFLRHHRELGIRHFVILDNGSQDGTIAYLRAQDDVTLLASDAVYRHYENTFKRFLCNRFGQDRWCLFVDVDELLAYPGMDRRSLEELAKFASDRGYTAVVTQMLDLYPDLPLAEMPPTENLDMRELCQFYELTDIERTNYSDKTGIGAPEAIASHSGGVRRRMFGTNNGLTKVSLFFNGRGVRAFHNWHHVLGVRIADFTVALLHYPFTRSFRDKVLEAARSGRYGWLTTDEYRSYATVMADNPSVAMQSDASMRYDGPKQLVDQGFLQTSAEFAVWAEMESQPASTEQVGTS